MKTYMKEEISILGSCSISVSHNGQTSILPVIIVCGSGPNFLGRYWLAQLKLDWETIFPMKQTTISHVLENFKDVFDDSLGELRGFTVKLQVDPQAQPVFWKPRQVPLKMKQKIKLEFAILECDGIIQSVQFSNWTAPVVPVIKPDRSFKVVWRIQNHC